MFETMKTGSMEILKNGVYTFLHMSFNKGIIEGYVLTAMVVLASILAPIALKELNFAEEKPIVVVHVPAEWGKAISIARRPRSVTILFEEGHIITVVHKSFWSSRYLVRIEWDG